MGKTANYGLPDWEKSDFIKMDDFNAAFGKIDEELKANADAVDAAGESVAALLTDLGSGGQNCRAVVGSYVGTGTHGEANKLTLQAPFTPLLVLITNPSNAADNGLMLWLRGMETGDNGYHDSYVTLEWGESTVSWYFTTKNGVSGPEYLHLNAKNKTYHYTILGC